MNFKPMAAAAALIVAGACAQAANAGVVLHDDFNSDTQQLNWSGDSVFTSNAVVDRGGAVASTDLIGTGFFDFFPGNGNYVDLDGTSGYGNEPTAGQLESNATFGPGQYVLTFDLGGNARGVMAKTTDISLGSTLIASLTLPSSEPLRRFSIPVVITGGTGGHLFFTEEGPSDQQGNILDNVTLTAVPEPATWAMMLAGFGGMGAAMRSTRRKQARAIAA